MFRRTLRRSRRLESAVRREQLRVQNRPARRATNRVVSQRDHSQIEHSVASNPADRHGHSTAGIDVTLWLWTIKRIANDERLLRSRRKSGRGRKSLPRLHRFYGRLRARLLVEANRHADRVTVLHWDAIRMRAHLERRARDLAVSVRAEQLQQLSLQLGLLVGDVRNHVPEYVE